MQLLLRAHALVLCLLFARTTYGQDITHHIEHITDTEEMHFEDYWRRANDAILTADGRARLEQGRTRLSLRAMSNPVRFGLIAASDASEARTAADLLCDNRRSGSLRLRCRMLGDSHSHRVSLTDTNCAGRPDLFTLIPEGCEHPYVLTVEERVVTLDVVTRPAAHVQRSPVERAPSEASEELEQTLNDQRSEINRLRHEVQDLQADRAELRREQQQTDHQLHRSYLALLLLIGLTVTAAIVVWRQQNKLGTVVSENGSLRNELNAFALESTRNSQESFKLRASQLQAKDFWLAGLRQEAQEYIEALLARNKALESELRSHKDRPSVIIDESAFKAEAVTAEAEARARRSVQELHEAQAVERVRMQDKIDQLLNLVEELRSNDVQLRRELGIRHTAYTEYNTQIESQLLDAEAKLREARGQAERANERVAALETENARLTLERSDIDEANRRLRLANRSLKSLIDKVSRHFHERELEMPDWFVLPGTDPLSIPTPPSTRTAPPPSHPPTNPPAEVTTAVIGTSPMQTPAGPPGAMKTGRQTLTGIGDESAQQGSARDTLRLTATAGAPSPTPQPMSPHHAPTTPPPPNYFRVEATAPLDSWGNPPSPSKPSGDDARHPPLAADTGDQTGLWMMSVGTDESNAIAINLAPIPRPDPLPVIQVAPNTEPPASPLPEQDPSSQQPSTPSIFQAPTQKMSLVDSERLIARTK